MRTSVVCLVVGIALVLAATGCGAADGSGSYDKTGSCDSICKKAADQHCSGDVAQADCVTQCKKTETACASDKDKYQNYLDCIESTPMHCGDTSMTATSDECVAAGLAILQCSLSGAGG
jgi:hypothetical protein